MLKGVINRIHSQKVDGTFCLFVLLLGTTSFAQPTPPLSYYKEIPYYRTIEVRLEPGQSMQLDMDATLTSCTAGSAKVRLEDIPVEPPPANDVQKVSMQPKLTIVNRQMPPSVYLLSIAPPYIQEACDTSMVLSRKIHRQLTLENPQTDRTRFMVILVPSYVQINNREIVGPEPICKP